MKGFTFKNDDEDDKINDSDSEHKQNVKNEKKKKRKKTKKTKQENENEKQPEQVSQDLPNDAPKELNHTVEPYENENYLVGYGTNAMIYNNNANESESSEDEGIEDYKNGGYPPIHVG